MLTKTIIAAQSSVLDWQMSYIRQLADVYYQRRLNRMYIHLLEGFLAVKPWESNPPLLWRAPKVHGYSDLRDYSGADAAWVPLNMRLPIDLVNRIKEVIAYENATNRDLIRTLSIRIFLYTAIYWWCTYVYPYKGPEMIPYTLVTE